MLLTGRRFKTSNIGDPVKNCEYYKHKGCAHVDGYLCLINECSTLLKYKDELERYKKIKKLSEATRKKVK